MPSDRRLFLRAGASGLATIILPEFSLAGHPARHRQVPCIPCQSVSLNGGAQPFDGKVHPFANTCFFSFYNPPMIPDSGNITPSGSHKVIVFGTNLASGKSQGITLGASIQEMNTSKEPNVVWQSTSYSLSTSIPPPANSGIPTGCESASFDATETGSVAGAGSLLISITASSPSWFYKCIWNFPAMGVTYGS